MERKEFDFEVAKRIKKLREEVKMTQKVLAEKAGLSEQMISLIETGNRGMSLYSLNNIAGALGKTCEFCIFLY